MEELVCRERRETLSEATTIGCLDQTRFKVCDLSTPAEKTLFCSFPHLSGNIQARPVPQWIWPYLPYFLI